jgi:hypothetical protein
LISEPSTYSTFSGSLGGDTVYGTGVSAPIHVAQVQRPQNETTRMPIAIERDLTRNWTPLQRVKDNTSQRRPHHCKSS